MPSKDDILAALAAVLGPDGKTPLPRSGAIDGVTVRDGKAFVAIRVDPAQAGAMEAMRAAAEAKIKALPGVVAAVVTLTAESEGPAAAPAARRPRPPTAQPIPGIEKIVASYREMAFSRYFQTARFGREASMWQRHIQRATCPGGVKCGR